MSFAEFKLTAILVLC